MGGFSITIKESILSHKTFNYTMSGYQNLYSRMWKIWYVQWNTLRSFHTWKYNQWKAREWNDSQSGSAFENFRENYHAIW